MNIAIPNAAAISSFTESPVDHVGGGSGSPLVELRPIEGLVGTEEIDPSVMHRLTNQIAACGEWTAPIPIDRELGLVMDGNHRLHAARALGLRCVPCVPLSYSDPRVSVVCWQSGKAFPIERILAVATTGNLLPYKSTRHRFEPPLPVVAIGLKVLLDLTNRTLVKTE